MHHLGPDRSLSLSTWDELVAAAKGGLLDENQWCELKQQLPPSDKKNNLELARDLAALSVHGGVLIIGIKDNGAEVVGLDEDVTALKSRISNVARTRVDPPLSPVIHDPIVGPGGRYVLIVSVPVSPLAPHMVADAYWGRSSIGKRKLTDAEVRSLMLSRKSSEEEFLTRLAGMVERDPLGVFVEDHPTGQGHVYLRAEPLAPMPPRSEDLDVQTLAFSGAEWADLWPSALTACRSEAFDPEGRAFASADSLYRRQCSAQWEHTLCYFSIKDKDGSIEVVHGGGTCIDGSTPERPDMVSDKLVAIITLQTLAMVHAFSLEVGYAGLWRVGVHITNLKGKTRYHDRFSGSFPAFTAACYTQAVLTSASEMEEGVEGVADTLLRGFKRGLGVERLSLSQLTGRR